MSSTQSQNTGLGRWRWLMVAIGLIFLCSCRSPLGVPGIGASQSTVQNQTAAPATQAYRQPAAPNAPAYAGRYNAPQRAAAANISHAGYQQPVGQPLASPQQMMPVGHQFPRDAWSGQPMIPPQYLPYARPCPHCGPGAHGQQGYCQDPAAGACYNCPQGFTDCYACQEWAPQGVVARYSRPDEYVCDGGDEPIAVRVDPDWSVHGLDIEDTVGHFDTIDGETKVVPSNKVCIYAPRFAAVRKVYGLEEQLATRKSAGYEMPVAPLLESDIGEPTTVKQHEEPIGAIGQHLPTTLLEETRGLVMRRAHPVIELFNQFATFEDFSMIRKGVFDLAEKPQLADSVLAAEVWTEKQAVQVVLDGVKALEGKTAFGLGSVYHSKRHPGKPRLRVIKVASHKEARPGDTIEFTLRYDNVGNETIGNVTLIDNLSPRLEYIEDSAQASPDHKANFFTEVNEKGSLVLRWEVIDPLEAGEGGIIRFKCKVR
ncbi:MAG: hypothetical protein NXI22_11045 [bacterium]|nr:hypothetical protein [bacterium]